MHQTDYRYKGYDLDPVKLAEAKIQVGAAMERTFGTGRGLAADHYLMGGYIFNDQPSTARLPRDCPAWVARIAKARRDIETIAAECRVRELADRISRDEVLLFIGEIKQWAALLKRV